MARVKVSYADGTTEIYVSSAVFRRARQGNEQAKFYSQYIQSAEWRTRRARHIERFPLCRGCAKPAEVVHHRTYASLGHEKTRDLLSLCHSCHIRVHGELAVREARLRRRGKTFVEMDNGRLWAVTKAVIRQTRRFHGLER